MTLTIALTKGRTETQVLPLLAAAGIHCEAIQAKSRRLIFADDPNFHFILVKAPDVLTYLNHGTVDIGIVGSDILAEQGHRQFDMLDLNTGRCRFILASTADFIQSRRNVNSSRPSTRTLRNSIFKSKARTLKSSKLKGLSN
ncbi:ATP phosphoribosyltransferase [Lacticaseibacillus paracasei]|nr:ATP phosphoribosyltransferase [Lacticaseibacillus paracasei]